MNVDARLIAVRVPKRPAGAVLVLHGGASRRHGMRVSPTQLSVLRMVPIARRIARAGRGRLAVFRLLNSVRGWDADHTPVDDVRWAVEEIHRTRGLDVPVCLVGHSLGARAAVLASGDPTIRGTVALAAFVYPEDGDVNAHAHQVLFVHGTRDRIAPLARAEATAAKLGRTARVEFVRIEGGKHAMLRHGHEFGACAARFAVRALIDDTVVP